MWIYKDKPLIEAPADKEGFIYLITNLTNGMKYIGRKFFYSRITRPPLKGKKRKRKIIKEMDWQNYWSSSNRLKADVESLGQDNFKREILFLCATRPALKQIETQLLFEYDALYKDDWYNDNVAGKYYQIKEIKEDYDNFMQRKSEIIID